MGCATGAPPIGTLVHGLHAQRVVGRAVRCSQRRRRLHTPAEGVRLGKGCAPRTVGAPTSMDSASSSAPSSSSPAADSAWVAGTSLVFLTIALLAKGTLQALFQGTWAARAALITRHRAEREAATATT